mmetsp:Transcript_84396/g.247523  ORF Transcript_84396/g.247523 Transcript_84396/m.247523 type:complete len:326 (-) Transcript_84396:367-1344(-)
MACRLRRPRRPRCRAQARPPPRRPRAPRQRRLPGSLGPRETTWPRASRSTAPPASTLLATPPAHSSARAARAMWTTLSSSMTQAEACSGRTSRAPLRSMRPPPSPSTPAAPCMSPGGRRATWRGPLQGRLTTSWPSTPTTARGNGSFKRAWPARIFLRARSVWTLLATSTWAAPATPRGSTGWPSTGRTAPSSGSGPAGARAGTTATRWRWTPRAAAPSSPAPLETTMRCLASAALVALTTSWSSTKPTALLTGWRKVPPAVATMPTVLPWAVTAKSSWPERPTEHRQDRARLVAWTPSWWHTARTAPGSGPRTWALKSGMLLML